MTVNDRFAHLHSVVSPSRICNDILGIIEESLIPNSTSEEAKVYVVRRRKQQASVGRVPNDLLLTQSFFVLPQFLLQDEG
jgi:hypothetical protein